MRVSRFSVLLGVVIAVLIHAAPVSAEPSGDVNDIKDTVKQTYDVEPGGTLRVEMDHGNLEVEATRGDRVYIEVERLIHVEDREKAQEVLSEHQLEFEGDEDEVFIRSKFPEDSKIWRGRSRIKVLVRVRVPVHYNVEFATGIGNVWIVDVEGTIDGKTGAGNIEIEAVRGEVALRSGTGGILLTDIRGPIEAKTGAGNIEVRDACGSLDVNSGAGNVEVIFDCQPDAGSTMASGAGNVTVYLPDEVRCDVDAVAGMGSAQTDFPLKVEGNWFKKSFEGELNGGGPDIRLRAGVGNVRLLRRP